MWRGLSVDSAVVEGRFCRGEQTEGLLNLKDLITKLMPSGRATSSGLIGRLGGREAYLLILLWLMERLPRRTSKAPLNLKDLISVLRSSGQATLSGFVGRQWESID